MDRVGGDPQVDGLPAVGSVLAVCAHPDDESFGLGATLAAFTVAGSSTAVLCFTHGESSTLGSNTRELGLVRAEELAAAASELGVDHVELFDYPDGALDRESLDRLAKDVRQVADRVRPDPAGLRRGENHSRATEAALMSARETGVPVLAWAIAEPVAAVMNEEFGTTFVGRSGEDLDLDVRVDRGPQRRAIICHASQAIDNPALLRRLELQANREVFRWLLVPSEASPGCSMTRQSPLPGQIDDREG